MNFNPNSGFLFVIAAIVITFVIAQSVFFLIRSYRHGIAIGMEKEKLKKTVISTATALGLSLSETITDPKAYSAIAWVMTLGIIPGLILIPLFLRRFRAVS